MGKVRDKEEEMRRFNTALTGILGGCEENGRGSFQTAEISPEVKKPSDWKFIRVSTFNAHTKNYCVMKL